MLCFVAAASAAAINNEEEKKQDKRGVVGVGYGGYGGYGGLGGLGGYGGYGAYGGYPGYGAPLVHGALAPAPLLHAPIGKLDWIDFLAISFEVSELFTDLRNSKKK